MSMKFLIVSDTHGRMYNLEEAMEREEFDGMIHCGDVEGMDDLIKSKVNGPCYMVMGRRIARPGGNLCGGAFQGCGYRTVRPYAPAGRRKAWKSLDCQSGQPHVSASDGKKTKLCYADDQRRG